MYANRLVYAAKAYRYAYRVRPRAGGRVQGAASLRGLNTYTYVITYEYTYTYLHIYRSVLQYKYLHFIYVIGILTKYLYLPICIPT